MQNPGLNEGFDAKLRSRCIIHTDNRSKEDIMFRLLIADDQIPDSNLSSEEDIREHYSKLYQSKGFVEGFVFMYNLIHFLKEYNYVVDCANNRSMAITLVKTKTYDVIILDLGWYPDMTLGWEIASEIQQHSSAQILMFSNRFVERKGKVDPKEVSPLELGKTTAAHGCLPVHKSYDKIFMDNLLIAVRWATLRKSPDELLVAKRKDYSFKMYRHLSNVLLGTIIASVACLIILICLIGYAFTTGNNVEQKALASISGVIIAFINGAIYKYVREYQKSC